jgi:hypothetical protein
MGITEPLPKSQIMVSKSIKFLGLKNFMELRTGMESICKKG